MLKGQGQWLTGGGGHEQHVATWCPRDAAASAQKGLPPSGHDLAVWAPDTGMTTGGGQGGAGNAKKAAEYIGPCLSCHCRHHHPLQLLITEQRRFSWMVISHGSVIKHLPKFWSICWCLAKQSVSPLYMISSLCKSNSPFLCHI